MNRKTLTRAVNALSAIALVIGQFILPVNVAFAEAAKGAVPQATSSWTTDPTGAKSAYVCKYVTSSTNGYLYPQSSENNPIKVAYKDGWVVGSDFPDSQHSFVIGFTTDSGGGQTNEPATADCPVIMTVLPGQPESTDPCNPIGAGSTFTNVAWTDPADDLNYHWVLNSDGSYSAVANTGYAFLYNNMFVYSIKFNLPADSGRECQGAPVPAAPAQYDPCNPFGEVAAPYWTETPVSNAMYTWKLNDDGSYTVRATAGSGYQLQLPDGSVVESQSYYLDADNRDKVCYDTIDVTVPTVAYTCGLTSTATWNTPQDTNQINWELVNGDLWAYAIGDIAFSYEQSLTQAINFGQASAKVTYTPCVITDPLPTITEACGVVANDTVTATAGEHYAANVIWNGSVATITYTAEAGYVFKSNGLDTLVITHTDKDELCPVDLPVLEQIDPCNPFGSVVKPYWTTTPTDTDEYVWTHDKTTGSYTVTAKAGYILTLKEGTASSYEYLLKADDSNKVCYQTVPAPTPPKPIYKCGPTSQSFWMIPEDSDINWVNKDGRLWAYAQPNTVFDYEGTLTDAIDFGLASENVEYRKCEIATPTFTSAVICGMENDTVTATAEEGDHYMATVSDWVEGVKTITFTAHEDYIFDNGKTTFTETYTDERTPCIAEYSTGYDYIDKCGLVNDSLLLPEDSEQVAYSYKVVDAHFIVTVTAKEGFVLNSDGATSLDFSIKMGDPESPVCPVGVGTAGAPAPVVAVAAATPRTQVQAMELPRSGPSDNNSAMTIMGLVASLMTYGAVLALQRRNA